MIIIGYQGIGKSTLAKKSEHYIDLESSSFWVNGKRNDNWYIEYIQIAEHLSKQGHVVFVSSHDVVRNQLKYSKENICCCVPSLELKEEWMNKLLIRYNKSGLEKDYKAYMNAKNRYEDNIIEIIESEFPCYILTDMSYDLQNVIEYTKPIYPYKDCYFHNK